MYIYYIVGFGLDKKSNCILVKKDRFLSETRDEKEYHVYIVGFV